MGKPNIIAIDGPAASGKSTLAKRLARALNYLYFDTGILYRAVTWAALQQGIDPNNETLMSQLAQNLQIQLQTDPETGETRIYYQGREISGELRSPQVDRWVSVVAAHPGVRQALREVQRRIALQGRIIVVGRDIGTVIVPEADLKIFLDASLEERARRRYREALARGHQVSLQQVLEDLQRRDALDSQRAVAPLRPARDAHIIHTNSLTPEEVFQRIMALIEECQA